MVSATTTLLGEGKHRRIGTHRLLIGSITTSCALLLVAYSFKGKASNELLTTVTSNCDGSVDITTFYPCTSAPVVAPTVFAPPVYLPQTVAPAVPSPLPFNTYQYPTIWNGGDVLSGGNPEWAQEDAAIHSANLANWRIRILQARKKQAEISKQLMDVISDGTSGPVTSSVSARLGNPLLNCLGGNKVKAVSKAVSTLAASTSKALSSIDKRLGSQGGTDGEVKRILKQMDKMAKEFQTEDSALSKDDPADVAAGV